MINLDNENLALVLVDNNTGEVFANITTNGEISLPSDVALVRNYSENDGETSSEDISLIDIQELFKILEQNRENLDKFYFEEVILEDLDSAHEYLKGLNELGKDISITAIKF